MGHAGQRTFLVAIHKLVVPGERVHVETEVMKDARPLVASKIKHVLVVPPTLHPPNRPRSALSGVRSRSKGVGAWEGLGAAI